MGISATSPSAAFRSRAEIFLDFLSNESFLLDDTNSSGTGTVSSVSGGDPNADEGYGILELDTGAGIGKARNEHGSSGTPFLAFRGSLKTVAELRVKFPATPSDISFSWGFNDLAGSSCQMSYTEGAGTWNTLSESQAGTDADQDATAVAAVAGWNTLRIEWDPGIEARFYANNVLISTIAIANAIPQGNDEMSVHQEADTVGATAGAIYLDWLRITSARK